VEEETLITGVGKRRIGCHAETLTCLASFTARSSITLSYIPRDLQHLRLLQMAPGLQAYPLTPHLGSFANLEQ